MRQLDSKISEAQGVIDSSTSMLAELRKVHEKR
jgi:hypothetical protein